MTFKIGTYIGRMAFLIVAAYTLNSVAADTVGIVDLPGYVKWCTNVMLPAQVASDEKAQQNARAAAVKLMDALLLKRQVQASGIPFIENPARIAAPGSKSSDAISMDICYVVDSATPAPDNVAVKASEVSGERAATLVCARAAEEQCIDRLHKALEKTMPSTSLDIIMNWPWRYAATVEIPKNLLDVASALTATDARPLLGDVRISVFGNVERPDPKKMRSLRTAPTGNVVTVPVEQGSWLVVMISLPK